MIKHVLKALRAAANCLEHYHQKEFNPDEIKRFRDRITTLASLFTDYFSPCSEPLLWQMSYDLLGSTYQALFDVSEYNDDDLKATLDLVKALEVAVPIHLDLP